MYRLTHKTALQPHEKTNPSYIYRETKVFSRLTKGSARFDLEEPSNSLVDSFPFLPRRKPAVVETFQTSYLLKSHIKSHCFQSLKSGNINTSG